MKRLTLTLLLGSATLFSCSREPQPGQPTPSAGGTAPTEVVPFVIGTIELTGKLAESTSGALQIVASSPELATPLVRKCPLESGERTPEGTLLVPFQLDSHCGMMASRAIPLDAMPAELSMKVSFSPDGYVEHIQHEHNLTLSVRVGDTAVRARMEPGQAPESRPTSRATSRPVLRED